MSEEQPQFRLPLAAGENQLPAGVTRNYDNTYDLKFPKGHAAETFLARLMCPGVTCNTMEVKAETGGIFRRTGNIAVEYKRRHFLTGEWENSGIAVTQANLWGHPLFTDDGLFVGGFVSPMVMWKILVREAIRKRDVAIGGDNDRQALALLKLADLLRYMMNGAPRI